MASLFVLAAVPACDSTSDAGPGADGGGEPEADAAVANACPAPVGTGTKHEGTISADETWTAAAGPHVVTFGIGVKSGVTLTIEPCAVVRVQDGYSFAVDGTLVAEGNPGHPITFERDDAGTAWGAIQANPTGSVRLAYASLEGGGSTAANIFGALEARGDQSVASQELVKVDHVAIVGSASYGASLRAGAAFTVDSTQLTITGSAKAAMRVLPRLASNIPTGSYVGNADDAIVVATEAYGEINYEDVTFHERGVPYRVGDAYTFGQLNVGPRHFKMTIEPGVRFLFNDAGWLRAESNAGTTGVIVANGTTSAPIVFTSGDATPVAGAWRGIVLGNVADPEIKLDHVEIRFAGGASQANGFHCKPNTTSQSDDEDAALAIFHEPGGAYLTNSVIADSAGEGVDNAYTGTYVDAHPTNTFTNVAGCAVTRPLPKVGICPDAPCP